MYRITYPSLPMKVRYAEFFDQHFLTFLHWMVYERYSSYKNVMKYFVNLEILELLKREAKLPSEKSGHKDAQTLVIFPDNWTRFNVLPPATFEEKNLISLVSTDTQNKKDLHRRSVKKGLATTIIATHSEVFQPFCNLKKILLYDPDKRYYNNQQDPRYTLPVVAEKMAEIYGAELVMK
ncbi:hypothetical protein J5893_02175 [bacterium]|nr:hypothetical protein [bacterium]